MPTTQLEPRYFERMAASFSDKARMVLPQLRGPRVLDLGAGGGELTAAIAAAGFQTSALDAAPDAIERLGALPLHAVRQGFAEQVPELFEERFDSIVASALMHEVYSYGLAPSSPPLSGYAAVRHTVGRLHSALEPGGRLIIRDGVMPHGSHVAAQVGRLTAADVEAFHDYRARTPHPELRALTLSGSLAAGWQIRGSRHAIAEFLFTLTWGIETFAREALERYQLFTLAGYPRFLRAAGFRAVHTESVVQPGYVAGLAHLSVTSAGSAWFPATNALWVFERGGERPAV